MKAALLLAVFLVIGVPTASAFQPEVQVPEGPYVPIEIDELESKQYWLGVLDGFPDLYQFTIIEPTTLYMELSQDTAETPSNFQILVVRENDDNGGVTEVLRQSIPSNEWEPRTILSFGLTRISAPAIAAELDPGTYRLEVSAPNNTGEYLLYAGTEAAGTPWLVSVADLWRINTHFGMSPLRMFLSMYVLIPIVLIGTAYAMHRRRQQLEHA